MDSGAWQATVHGVEKRHVTEQARTQWTGPWTLKILWWKGGHCGTRQLVGGGKGMIGKSFHVSSGWCVSSTQTILYLTAKLTSLLLAKNP